MIDSILDLIHYVGAIGAIIWMLNDIEQEIKNVRVSIEGLAGEGKDSD